MRSEEDGLALSKPVRALLTAVLIIGAIFTPIPFPLKVPTVAALALLWVWIENRSLEQIGLKLPRRRRDTLLWAAASALGVILVIGEMILPFIEWAFSMEVDHSGYGPLKGNAQVAFQLWLFAMLSAAVAEEIVFRGFLLHQLSLLSPDSQIGRGIAILIGSIAFALPHYAQGVVGLTSVVLVGILFGWVFFRSGRNLWSLILAHALVDTWGIYFLYRGW
jgi:membrane protease YdiL (CAAX protease family)